jgi:cobalt-zinc-cadmium resistance protein CzcA
MASLLAMLGLLPMAVSTGVGSETQRPFAVVIVGGMLTTLLVTLFVLPILYTFITPKRLLTPEEADEL